MSASLVGSEMCIRDRSWGPPPRRLRLSPAAAAAFGVPAGPLAHPSSSPCLLYTSDAADDM
eukprot:5674727-Alexandrium_andersonii.AAC.1